MQKTALWLSLSLILVGETRAGELVNFLALFPFSHVARNLVAWDMCLETAQNSIESRKSRKTRTDATESIEFLTTNRKNALQNAARRKNFFSVKAATHDLQIVNGRTTSQDVAWRRVATTAENFCSRFSRFDRARFGRKFPPRRSS